MNGISASSGGPSLSKPGGAGRHLGEHPPQQGEDHAGQHEQHGRRAVVAAELLQHPGGHREQDARAHREAPLDEGQERLLDVVGAGALEQRGGGVVGEEQAVAHQQQPVAALRLVHHVAGDQHRGALVGQPVEHRPQVAAQHRVEADGGLVEHEQLRLAEQRDRQGGPRLLAAGEVGRPRCRDGCPRSTASTHRATSSPSMAEHACEEAQVLRDGEVVVHARRLGDVADPVPQVLVAGRQPEHGDGPALRRSARPTSARIRRGLAAARRTEQSGDLARLGGERDAVDRAVAAAGHVQVGAPRRRVGLLIPAPRRARS